MCACACARAHVHDHVLHVRAKSALMVRMISMRIGRDLLLLQLLLLGEQRLDCAADVASPRLGLGLVREREVHALLASQAGQAFVARECRNHRGVRQLQARHLTPAVIPGDPVVPHGGPTPDEEFGLGRFNQCVTSQQLGLARRHGQAV